MNLGNTAMKFVYGFLGVILLLALGSAMLPLVMNYTATVGAIANLPLATLFSGGVITLIIVVAVIVSIIKASSGVSK
jgi:hypothetical protein